MAIAQRATAGPRRAWRSVAAVAAGFLLASCSTNPASTVAGTSAHAGQPATGSHRSTVSSLTGISTLRSLFNRADGHTRLVLIFSPT
jgi:hypothetical protein